MIDEFNQNINRDIPMLVDGRPNGALLVVDWCIKNYLDNERSILNVGAFTGRDLDWMLPICSKYSKPIECVEDWNMLSSQALRRQIIKEIESTRKHHLVTWTWDDATEAKTISSADFFWITTTWNQFDLQNHMRSINHPSIWMLNPGTIWWGIKLLSSLLYQEKIHHMFSSPDLFLFTNVPSIHEQFIDDFDKLNPLIKRHNQYLEVCDACIRWRKKGVAGNQQFEEFIKQIE